MVSSEKTVDHSAPRRAHQVEMRTRELLILVLAAGCGDDGAQSASGGATTDTGTVATDTDTSHTSSGGSGGSSASDSSDGSGNMDASTSGVDDSGDTGGSSGTDDTAETDGTGTTGDPSVCGDGIVEGLEVCDGDQGCLSDCTYPPNTVFWELIETGVGPDDDARVWGVDFDSDDRPVYAGRRFGPGGNAFATVREASSDLVWSQIFTPVAGLTGAYGLVVGADNRLVLAGQLTSGGPDSGNDALAMSFLADGTPDWEWPLFNDANGLRVAAAALSDGSYVVAGLENQHVDDTPDYAQLTLLDEGGSALWTVNHAGGDLDNQFTDVVVLPDGTIVAVGCCDDAGSHIVVGYDTDGVQQWLTPLAESGLLAFFSGGLAVAPDGNAIVAWPTAADTVWLGAIDGTGALVWGEEIGGTEDVHPAGVAATPQGTFVVAGQQVVGATSAPWYGLVDDSATLQWSDTVDPPGAGEAGRFYAVASDAHGRVLLGGDVQTSAGPVPDIRGLVRYIAP